MKNVYPIYWFLVGLVLISCQNNPSTQKEKTKQAPLTEIITETYSVKEVDGAFLKDTINMIQSYIVDQKGKELTNIFYNLDKSIAWSDEYLFNKKGHKSGSKFFDKGKKQTAYYEYDLDSLGQRISYRALDINTDTLLYDGASRYEKNGQLRKDGFLNSKGEFKWNYEYYFDKTGKALSFTYINLQTGERFPSDYDYLRYNEDGEWLERKIIQDKKVSAIELRRFVLVK